MTSANKIGRFNYATHKWECFSIPTLASFPPSIYHGPNDGIWFLETVGTKFSRFDRKTHKIEEYPLGLAGFAPIVVRSETFDENGDATIWVTCSGGGRVAGINLRTEKVTVIMEPSFASTAEQVAQDYNDNAWIAHALQNTIGVLNSRTGNITELRVPGTINGDSPNVIPYGGTGIFAKLIGAPTFGHKSAGNAMWFTQLRLNRLLILNLKGLTFPGSEAL